MDETPTIGELISRSAGGQLTQRDQQSREFVWQRPVAAAESIVQQLSPVLTLCCPSGMTADDREEWLLAAAMKIRQIGLTDYIVRDALRDLAVDHPSKILPAILDYVGKWKNEKIYKSTPSPTKPVSIEPPIDPMPISEVRTLSRTFIRMGMEKGWILPDVGEAVLAEQAREIEHG